VLERGKRTTKKEKRVPYPSATTISMEGGSVTFDGPISAPYPRKSAGVKKRKERKEESSAIFSSKEEIEVARVSA